MRNQTIIPLALLALAGMALVARADMGEGKLDGKREFEKHCGRCHANGGNSVNPEKPLSKALMAPEGVKSWQDVVAKMRKPGPGMPSFPKAEISDPEARAIAEYVLTTFP